MIFVHSSARVRDTSTQVDKTTADEPCSRIALIVHEMSESFGRAIDAKDPFTKNHSDEVAVVAQAVALAMGLSAGTADVIHIAWHLHDIGKIGVPDSVLTKTSSLSEEEWQLIRKHPATGAKILSPVQAMSRMGVPDLVHCHHERYDGQGYPRGLAGRDIPLGSRIITLADSLSAMLQQRPYRTGLDFDEACREIERCAGTHFDPVVVEAFFRTREPIRQMMLSILSESSSPLTQIKDTELSASGRNRQNRFSRRPSQTVVYGRRLWGEQSFQGVPVDSLGQLVGFFRRGLDFDDQGLRLSVGKAGPRLSGHAGRITVVARFPTRA